MNYNGTWTVASGVPSATVEEITEFKFCPLPLPTRDNNTANTHRALYKLQSLWTIMIPGCVCTLSLSHVCLFGTSWTVGRQAPLSMGILQARTLKWVAMPFSRGSSSRDRTQVSCVTGIFFTIWATKEAHDTWLPGIYSNLDKERIFGIPILQWGYWGSHRLFRKWSLTLSFLFPYNQKT